MKLLIKGVFLHDQHSIIIYVFLGFYYFSSHFQILFVYYEEPIMLIQSHIKFIWKQNHVIAAKVKYKQLSHS